MARLITVGAEVRLASPPDSGAAIDGFSSGAGTLSRDATIFRSGSRSYKFDTAGGGTTTLNFNITLDTTSGSYWLRVYFRIPATFSSNFTLITLSSAIITLNTDGTLTMGIGTGAHSNSIVDDTWHMVEAFVAHGSGIVTSAEFKVDRVLVDQKGASTPAGANTCTIGFHSAPSTNNILYADDIAVNDNTGADQNTYPGEGKIILLLPISDNERGSWTGGAGGTTNLFDAINNLPPIGTAAETDLTQIENTISSATAPNGDFNCTTYADAGIGPNDVVTLVVPIANHGEDIATNTKTGTIAVASNPAGSASASFNFGADLGALGTFPSNWSWSIGTYIYNPSITKNTSPVVRITKTDTGTRVASCDFLGIYCEYVPHAPISPYVHSEAKNRASTW